MKESEKQSKLAILREFSGLSQRDLASMVGRSIHTIQAIEQGKLTMSPGLASSVSQATGVTINWLLDPTPSPPSLVEQAIACGKKDRAYPLEKKLRQILEDARKRPDFDLCLYRVDQFLQKLETEFPQPTKKGSSP
jgi:transcriptional regulator with XRE-family HTH domain